MKLRLTPALLVTGFLALCIAVFGWRVARVVLNPIRPPQIGTIAGAATAPQAQLPAAPHAPADGELGDLNGRPLFWESRRPIVAKQTEEPVKEGPKVSVAGIIYSGKSRVAFLAAEGKPVTRVVEGDEYEGWKLIKVESQKVTLQGPLGTVEVAYDPRQRFAPPPAAGGKAPGIPGMPGIPGAPQPPRLPQSFSPPQPPQAAQAAEQRRLELERQRKERQRR